MSIVATPRDLDKRRQHIIKMLRPIRGEPDVGCGIGAGPDARATVLYAHEGTPTRRDYRDARFRTRARRLWCQYFELWRERNGGSELVLDRAYLNMYSVDGHREGLKELVCVHSDPTDESDMKRGPHLHVVQAVNPIPKCHFPLNYQDLERTLQTAHTLTDALRSAIQILDREVVERFCPGKSASGEGRA